MATEWVLDASIAAKLIVTEPDSERTRDFLDGLDADLIAPSLLRYEVGNAVTKRGPFERLEAIIEGTLAAVLAVDPVDVTSHCGPLSYYDAAYLALAVERKAGLLTADEKLRKAAKKLGIEVGP